MKFYVDEFDRLAMTLEDYEMLSNEQKQKLDRNYWRLICTQFSGHR